jgi:hypothetical protein
VAEGEGQDDADRVRAVLVGRLGHGPMSRADAGRAFR